MANGIEPAEMPDDIFFYDAFISYRHGGEDQEVAEWLHKALETFRTPAELVQRGVRPKLDRLFRDREELPTSSNLSDSIVEALEKSRFLIVICSPQARRRPWIAREIEIFKGLGRADRILTLLIEGEPEEAFPDGLIEWRNSIARGPEGEVRETLELAEPLAADIRAPDRKERRRKLKIEYLRLLAPLLGCSYDDLRQRHLERARRWMKLVAGSAAALATLFAGLATVAVVNWQEAEAQRRTAVLARDDAARERDQARAIQSRLMARTGEELIAEGRAEWAVQVAIEALKGKSADDPPPEQPEAIRTLRRSLIADHVVAHLRPSEGGVLSIALDGVNNRALLVSDAKKAELRSVPNGILMRTINPSDPRPYLKAWFSQSGARFALAAEGGRLDVFESTGASPPTSITLAGSVEAVDLDDHSGTIFVAASQENLSRFDLFSGDGKLLRHIGEASDWALSGDGKKLAMQRQGRIEVLDVMTGNITGSLPLEEDFLDSLALNHDGSVLAYMLGLYSSTFVHDLRTGKEIDFKPDQYRTEDIWFSPVKAEFGELFLTTGWNGSAVWLFDEGEVSPVMQLQDGMMFLSSGLLARSAADDSYERYTLRLLEIVAQSRGGYDTDEKLRAHLPGPASPDGDVTLVSDPQGRFVGFVDDEGTAVIHAIIEPTKEVVLSPATDFERIESNADNIIIGFERDEAGGHRVHRLDARTLRPIADPVTVDIDTEYGLAFRIEGDIAIDPDGKRIAWRHSDGTIRVRRLDDAPLDTLIVPDIPFGSVLSFTTEGAVLPIRNGDEIEVSNLDAGTATLLRAKSIGPGTLSVTRDAKAVTLATLDAFYLARIDTDEHFFPIAKFPSELETTDETFWKLDNSTKVLCATNGSIIVRFDLDTGVFVQSDAGAGLENLRAIGGRCFAETEGNNQLVVFGADGQDIGSEYPLRSEHYFSGLPSLEAVIANGDRLAVSKAEGAELSVFRLDYRREGLLDWAARHPRPCLSEKARAEVGLDPGRPGWCPDDPFANLAR